MERTYLAEEIFEDIPGDPDNVIMKFPPDLIKELGWKEGDSIDVKLENGAIVLQRI
jgi:hypothetical protein